MMAKPSIRKRIVRWLLRTLPPCKVVVRLASESNERRLTIRERVLMRLHFWVCDWCQRYMEQTQSIRRACLRMGRNTARYRSQPMPEESRMRLKRRLREAMDEGS